MQQENKIEIQGELFWKKYQIPVFNICTDCILRHLMAFRNERKLYKSKSNLSWKEIISLYSPDKPYTVYSSEEWFSDKWSPFNYSQDYNFWASFFSQFENLFLKVPKVNLYNLNCENSEYNNGLTDSKNAYLNFYWTAIIDSNYTTAWYEVSNSNDIWWSAFIDNSYEIISCDKMYNSSFCNNCSTWKNLIFCEECTNCEECIMCFGLNWKKYFIENKQYSKEEYIEFKSNFKIWNYRELQKYKKDYRDFLLKFPQKSTHSTSCENCSWDYIYESKNCNDCFTVVGWEDGYNVFEWARFLEVYNSSCIYDSKYVFNSVLITENSYKIFFSSGIWNSNNIYYSILLEWCSNCFGCTGLRNASYCILNKQYTKEEYEELVPKIIEHMMTPSKSPSTKGEVRNEQGEWWNFFPASISPFWYNETVAEDFFPLTREEALKSWFIWSDYESPRPNVIKIIPAEKLPYNISDIPDDILNRAIECEITKKPFRIIKQELEFYRKHSLPIPRRHPDQRHLDRMNLRNSKKLYDRKCDKCGVDIKTTYPLDKEEIVYCESCYNKENY